ncbi:MAG: glycosyltransferase family 2 protein [Synechococcaceae cyanobacterium]|nr:glycosyltransferase family 2 protein [Synechococcaceae cyanobacterium]
MSSPSTSAAAAIPAEVGALITPMILCCDEEANIARVLSRLTWAHRILLIDSGSRDGTLRLAAAHPQVEVLQRPFDSFAGQCNFGLARITTPWVLSLDADYVLSTAFLAELRRFDPPAAVAGYRVPLRYCIAGRPLRGTLLPPRVCLYRLPRAHYEDDGHSHRVRLPGQVDPFPAEILHDDRKSLDRWLQSQRRYLGQEARKLRDTPLAQLSRFDRLRRRTLLMPLLALPYCLLIKGGLLDGWRGWYYAFQRVYAELLLALLLLEADHAASLAGSTLPEA